MKNANGTGTIYKLNRPLRKPYVAKAPATYDGISASPKQKIIGYFATKKEAMIALGDYLKTPLIRSLFFYLILVQMRFFAYN